MKIGIVTLGADSRQPAVARYVSSLLREFAMLGSGHQFDVVVPEAQKPAFARDSSAWHWITVPDYWRSPGAGVLWQQFGLARLATRRKWDAVFIPGGGAVLPSLMPCPVISALHELPGESPAAPAGWVRKLWFRHLWPRMMRRLDGIITTSRRGQREIVARTQAEEARIDVVPRAHDVHAGLIPDTVEAKVRVAKKYHVSGPFLLYVSDIEHPRKNHMRLIRAFEQATARLPEGCKLVFVGANREGALEVRRAAEESSASGSIVFAGVASRRELSDLYVSAHAVVLPSLREGFCNELLEAMAHMVPVACSNRSWMREVAGDAVLRFDPMDERAMARALDQIANDVSLRRILVSKGRSRAQLFSWAKTALRTLASIERAVRIRTASAAPMRLAVPRLVPAERNQWRALSPAELVPVRSRS
jgi:glycosyltransferase involved in cell wall biosynthesis